MSQSEARRLRRLCKRKGHPPYLTKTLSDGTRYCGACDRVIEVAA